MTFDDWTVPIPTKSAFSDLHTVCLTHPDCTYKTYNYFCDGRAEHVRIAGEAGALMTCLTCFADDCLEEDMTACPSGHLFCRDCLRRASEVAIGDAKVELKCLGKELYLVYFHERIISPSKHSIHLERVFWTILWTRTDSDWLRSIKFFSKSRKFCPIPSCMDFTEKINHRKHFC